MAMAAEVGSIARLLRGEAGKRGGARPEMVTMDLLGGCGGDAVSSGDDEVVDLDVKVPAGWERRLDLTSGKTFLTPRNQAVQGGGGGGRKDLSLPPPPAAAVTTSAAVCTLDMVRSALERATAARSAASQPTSSSSSASTSSSSSSSVGKRLRSPPATTTASPPSMRAAACASCLTYVLIVEADPKCPRCHAMVPPLAAKSADASGKKPRIDLNAAADETE
ncbi:trinucleotide repeat-containing gene 18 protein [Brachypodium distachyon]|uniref:GIR1-like zinc ribbon domain-containing protein n=1 Tax=Brachypodium distachyon TaxID=15368 RepID=A0A0Q3E9R6_BRADI|nr:trinucleotide repeat-containing gene 18 protein [Brachypodium distachyon]KQJ84622.1 hypothetical protein BRADI_5g21895v3 [Brachypodium distachyon]|eukprot:XP_003580557.2 trinucleotide repeat-containing gene 18 protein [Brachypodium distachyon]